MTDWLDIKTQRHTEIERRSGSGTGCEGNYLSLTVEHEISVRSDGLSWEVTMYKYF